MKTRDAVGLGIDTMSIDPGASKTYPVHQFTAKASVYQLENVANLGLVPATGATVVVAPIKLENGSGGPARRAGAGEVASRPALLRHDATDTAYS